MPLALEVINASTGEFVATQERLLEDVLSGKFEYGFALDLMNKDCNIDTDFMVVHFPEAGLIKGVSSIMKRACNSPLRGLEGLHERFKYLEALAKIDLRVDNQPDLPRYS